MSNEVHSGKEDVCHCKACEQARLDAYKAGMTRAIEKAKRRSDGTLGASSARLRLVAEITAERDNLKEIPNE